MHEWVYDMESANCVKRKKNERKKALQLILLFTHLFMCNRSFDVRFDVRCENGNGRYSKWIIRYDMPIYSNVRRTSLRLWPHKRLTCQNLFLLFFSTFQMAIAIRTSWNLHLTEQLNSRYTRKYRYFYIKIDK